MGGGLMQLVAYGAQDIYLTGNPQITFFKVVYRRHTNFSMECIEQTINGGNIANGGSSSVTISRNGDLVSNVYITSDNAYIVNGSKLIKDVELEIGGQKIDKHTNEWMDIWNELTTPSSKQSACRIMNSISQYESNGKGIIRQTQIPLQFWFCRNVGLALPLIALQYHEVKIQINWGLKEQYALNASEDAICNVNVDYIYLDTDERRRFAQVSHEYLIEQVQEDILDSDESRINFNHPVKELIWTGESGKTQIRLNGHSRFDTMESQYFSLRQSYQHHTSVPLKSLSESLIIQKKNYIAINSLNYSNCMLHNNNTADINAKISDDGSKSLVVYEKLSGLNLTDALRLNIKKGNILRGLLGGENSNFVGEGDIIYFNINQEQSVGQSVGHTIVSHDGTVLPTSDAADLDHAGIAAFNQNDVTKKFKKNENKRLFYSRIINVSDDTEKLMLTIDSIRSLDGRYKLSLNPATASMTPRQLSVGLGIVRGSNTSKFSKKINVYSFALKPEEHQPSGTCNFSRIDIAELNRFINFSNADLKTLYSQISQNIYAVNYNVLRIMSGMGGLAYSN